MFLDKNRTMGNAQKYNICIQVYGYQTGRQNVLPLSTPKLCSAFSMTTLLILSLVAAVNLSKLQATGREFSQASVKVRLTQAANLK
jgi:hypothetical protein